jgi:guanosine-3',5'-bis(diphosphate) 3'-pyrophosphohydrolase
MSLLQKQEGIPAPERARMFAAIAHGSQTYNDEVPYTVHLEMVVKVLSRFGFEDPIMICAAWLHDVVEDTNRSYNDIKKRFGEVVAELVYAVTSELGRNRDERNAKTYPKLKGNEMATAIKLADRIANTEYGSATNSDMRKRYVKEWPGFKAAIRVSENEDPRVTNMWNYLDTLLAA